MNTILVFALFFVHVSFRARFIARRCKELAAI